MKQHYMAPKTECVKIQMGTLLGTWSLNGNNVDVDGTKDPSSRYSNQLWDDEEEEEWMNEPQKETCPKANSVGVGLLSYSVLGKFSSRYCFM